jgi:hypothetical protein
MWKARLEAELAAEQRRAERRAAREAGQENWKDAWDQYKAHWGAGQFSLLPPWWHVRAWLRILFGKSRPHR